MTATPSVRETSPVLAAARAQEDAAFRLLAARARTSRRSGDKWLVVAIDAVRAEREPGGRPAPTHLAVPHRTTFSHNAYKAARVLLRLTPPYFRTEGHKALLSALTWADSGAPPTPKENR